MMVERHKIDSWTIGSKVTYMRLTTFDHLAEVIDWQMNVEAEKSHQDSHQLRRCIELQIEMHRATVYRLQHTGSKDPRHKLYLQVVGPTCNHPTDPAISSVWDSWGSEERI